MPWADQDTEDHLRRLNEHIANIIKERFAAGHSIVAAKDGKLVRMHPDGTIEVLKDLPPKRQVLKGTSFTIEPHNQDGTDDI